VSEFIFKALIHINVMLYYLLRVVVSVTSLPVPQTMNNNAERKFVNLRKRLDQLGYRNPLGIESLPLVEKLFR